jgi:hypothetical protein
VGLRGHGPGPSSRILDISGHWLLGIGTVHISDTTIQLAGSGQSNQPNRKNFHVSLFPSGKPCNWFRRVNRFLRAGIAPSHLRYASAAHRNVPLTRPLIVDYRVVPNWAVTCVRLEMCTRLQKDLLWLIFGQRFELFLESPPVVGVRSGARSLAEERR